MRFRLRCWSWVHVSKIRKEMPRDRLTRERATGTISFHVLTDAVCGRVAQLVEQRTENPRAEGSSPPPTTTMMTVPRILAIRGTFRLKSSWRVSELGLFANMNTITSKPYGALRNSRRIMRIMRIS